MVKENKIFHLKRGIHKELLLYSLPVDKSEIKNIKEGDTPAKWNNPVDDLSFFITFIRN